MSHATSSVSLSDVPQIVSAEPLKLSVATRAVLWILVVLGIVAFVQGIMSANPQQAWVSFQVNFIYWFFLAASSTCFGAAFHISNAQWARPILRLFAATSDFFLFSLIPLVVLYFGRQYLFEWARGPVVGHEMWLEPKFVYIRDFFAMAFLILVGRRIVFLSLQRDIGAIRKGLTGLSADKLTRWEHKSYDKFLTGWGSGSAQSEVQAVNDKMGRLSPWIVIIYAVLLSLITWDQVMSVDAHWYSTLFGPFVFMSGVYVCMAWCGITAGFARELHPIFRAKIERRTLHDLGKLLFGFGIFWAYLFWSHYLTIWYGNMPEETHWVILRLREEPWHSFAWTVFGLCFITPFFLGISRDLKQVPVLLALTGVVVACGIWFQSYLLIAPSIYPNGIPLGITDVAIAAGFLGAFLLSVASFLGRVPLIPFGDLYLKK